MAMREREEWNEAKPNGMLNVFQSTLSRSENEVRIWNLHLQNWEDSANIWQVCTIHTVMSTDSTVLLLSTKQSRKSTQWGESSFTRAQRYLNMKYGEVSLQIKFTTLLPKPQPLYEMKWKGNRENKENAVRLIVHSITRRGEMWRGGGSVKWRDSGGGAAPLY